MIESRLPVVRLHLTGSTYDKMATGLIDYAIMRSNSENKQYWLFAPPAMNVSNFTYNFGRHVIPPTPPTDLSRMAEEIALKCMSIVSITPRSGMTQWSLLARASVEGEKTHREDDYLSEENMICLFCLRGKSDFKFEVSAGDTRQFRLEPGDVFIYKRTYRHCWRFEENDEETGERIVLTTRWGSPDFLSVPKKSF